MNKNKFLILIIFSLSFALMYAGTRKHLVRPGDTLYSLAKRYEVTVEAIQEANPSIEGTNIPTGVTLIIPDIIEEKKEKKSFLSNIFGKKDKKDKNKENKEIIDSDTITDIVDTIISEPIIPVLTQRTKPIGAPDNIVVILPFRLDARSAIDDRQQMRSVEFYEGLLLAVKEAEQLGQKILVQTYDLGTKSMGEILATKSLLDADVIIAPMDLPDVKAVAEFGMEHDINVVSPFVFNQDLSANNKNIIQLNTSKSLLYEDLTNDILSRFEDYSIVFLNDSSYISKADPYADYLRKELTSRNHQFHEFFYGNPEPLAKIDTLLNIVGNNILYVPVANAKESLQKMFPCLQCTAFDPELGALNKGQTAILGYPEWILYSEDFMDYYYDMNVYMFSKFYINPFDENVKQFYADFHYWYAKEPMPLTPRYALLGFDVGRFFLAAIRQHGMKWGDALEAFSKPTLQSMMSYRHDGAGFVNKGLYLVHFTPSTQIEKYEIK